MFSFSDLVPATVHILIFDMIDNVNHSSHRKPIRSFPEIHLDYISCRPPGLALDESIYTMYASRRGMGLWMVRQRETIN